MATILSGSTLRLSGVVGDFDYQDHFTATDIVLALAEVDDEAELTVHINSPGGIASEGAAIHALFSARAGKNVVVVEGIAASAASLIAMCGDVVTMSAGAVMMIHDPSGFTWGTSADHSKTIDGLEALATSYARVYSAKSGKTTDECRAIMVEETWFDPQEAVDAGFADDTTEAKAEPVAAFDYRLFAHAPKNLTVLAKRENWTLHGGSKPKANRLPPQKSGKDIPMTKTVSAADAHASATARIKAIMQAAEADGREKLAEHLAFETEMPPDAAIAVMSAAPMASSQTPAPDPAEAYAARRAAAAGLAGPVPGRGAPRNGLVAAMQKQHGQKSQ